MQKSVKLSPPWVIFYREIEALFKEDPDIRITYDEIGNVITLRVNNAEKAEALSKLLPVEKIFGNVAVQIRVIPPNGVETTKATLFEQAFDGNPIFSNMTTIEGIFTYPISYVVFRKEVVQFYTDDLSDINGLRSTLYQDIAKDVFGDTDSIFFCTDGPNKETLK